ncbi:MAG TPA: hypothetical protein VEE84_01745 [Burkholderiaceae bacterium]|nr:hypothetical protein [Burkholderiaceae bacterium]
MAKRYKFELALGTVLLVLWLAVWTWQNPGYTGQRLTDQDVDRYMSAVEKLPFPAEERAQTLQYVRSWMQRDDGKPVYMLNLMRFYGELRRFAGSVDFHGSPRESNVIYESAAMPMLLKLGGYPIYAGQPQGKNLIEHRVELDDWNRVLVVRYPSRRAFMDLVSDPAYLKIEPYKLMALLVVLTPMTAEVAMPELPWLVGALLLIAFLAAGWQRAARRAREISSIINSSKR